MRVTLSPDATVIVRCSTATPAGSVLTTVQGGVPEAAGGGPAVVVVAGVVVEVVEPACGCVDRVVVSAAEVPGRRRVATAVRAAMATAARGTAPGGRRRVVCRGTWSA